jgi:hypothetical protein
MESWQFIQSPAGDWYWLCSNVISRQTRTSAATFKTRMECVANAMVSGYQKIAPGSGGNSGGGNNAAPVKQHKEYSKAAPPAGGQPAAKRSQRRNRNKSGKRSTKSNQTAS